MKQTRAHGWTKLRRFQIWLCCTGIEPFPGWRLTKALPKASAAAIFITGALTTHYAVGLMRLQPILSVCRPDTWRSACGLVQLYRHVYDTVRPQVDPQTKVFATFTFQQLLGYDLEACHGPMAYESCTGDSTPIVLIRPKS
jgi:hypothetical protein